jgi:hypothetical protein
VGELRKHPEGTTHLEAQRLVADPEAEPFEPEGLGWTKTNTDVPQSFTRVTLLTDHNVTSVRHNHPVEWAAAMEAIEAALPERKVRDQRTGAFINSVSVQEQERLVALSLLVDLGVVGEVPVAAKRDA